MTSAASPSVKLRSGEVGAGARLGVHCGVMWQDAAESGEGAWVQ